MVKAVARAHVEPRLLDRLEFCEPRLPVLALGERADHGFVVSPAREVRVQATNAGQASEAAQLGVGAKQQDVDPRHHLRDVLLGHLRQRGLDEIGKCQIGAVAEQQELHVVLPHALVHAQRSAPSVEHTVKRRVAVFERHLVALVFVERGHLERGDLRDQRVHLLLPAGVEPVPVGEVVPGALLEVADPLRDQIGICDGVGRDVHVAVDDPVVDAHRWGNREDAVLPVRKCVIRAVDRHHVERRHRVGEVHRIPEPQSALVCFAAILVERRVIRVHLLPALATVRRGDLAGAWERGRPCGGGAHKPLLLSPPR